MTKLFMKAALPALTLGLLLSACGGGGNDLDDRTNTAEPQLRLIHAAPVAPALTLYRGNVADSSNVSYKGYTNYHDTLFGAGTLNLQAAAAPGVNLASVPIDSRRGRKYTALALPNGVGADLLLIDDPYNKPVGNDQARIRVVNGASNATPVDVYVTATGADLTTAAPNVAALAYKQALPASGSDALEFTDGTYQLRITPAGSKSPVIFSAPLALAKNQDVVLITVPSTVGAPANDVHVLRVNADDNSGTATDIATQ